MAMRALGWGDRDLYALLVLFREHLRHYVYASMDDFATAVHAEMPNKQVVEIQEMVRALMMEFGVVLSTKNFRKDVLRVGNQEVWVYEHLYESISEMAENKAGGGVWLPDELTRFFQKAMQYRKLFQPNQDTYFSRIQIWGKSVADTKSKFYALRDMYMKEKKLLVRLPPRKQVDATRFDLMKVLFDKVPPAPCEKKPDTVISKKQPKLWTPADLDMLLDFLVRITKDVQTTGCSALVSSVARDLCRTEQSCYNKLQDMRERYVKKSTFHRAAHLPDSIYDPNSEAHKIFNADWDDPNDPYAVGYFALRSHCNKVIANRHRHRKKNVLGIVPSRRKLRPKHRETSTPGASNPARSTTVTTPNTRASLGRTAAGQGPSDRVSDHYAKTGSKKRKDAAGTKAPAPRTKAQMHKQSQSQSQSQSLEDKPAAVPTMRDRTTDYDEFVRDMVLQCNWTDAVAINVLRAMEASIDLHRAGNFGGFWKKVAELTPGVTAIDLWTNGCSILRQYEMRFGLLGASKTLIPSQREVGEVTPVTNTEQAVHEPGHSVESLGGNPEQATLPSEAEDEQGKSNDEDTIAIGDDEEREDPLKVKSPDHQHVSTDAGNEEATQSIVKTKSSPDDGNWGVEAEDDAADSDAGVDDDSFDNQSVDSSDNTWSGSNNGFDSKDAHETKGKSPLPLDEHYSKDGSRPAVSDSKKAIKRGKDESYGKSFALAKKRRLQAKAAFADKDNEEDDDEEEDEEDEDQSLADEEIDDEPPEDSDGSDSDSEQEKGPHPLQDMLNSLGAHIAELETKNRELIQQKEDRERRQRHFPLHHREFRVGLASYASDV